jgi:riboflavin synthase
MFTGIIEETGTVVQAGARLQVRARIAAEGSDVAASVAVNGVCLTVVEATSEPVNGADATGGPAPVVLGFDLADETLARTSLGRLRPGDRVNLERPVLAEGRLGGHLVQGHVDGVGAVAAVRDVRTGREMRIRLPDTLRRYVAEKGSVTIDGVSLTVAGVDGDGFDVALIPYTLAATTLGERGIGDEVNLEVDVIARYVDRLLEASR